MESDRPEHNEMPATAVRDVGEAPVASVASEAPQAPLRSGWKRSLSVFAACFVVYLAVLEGFLAVPQFNDIVQIRPASALGPVFGLFFGLPGVFGCATANLVSDILHEGATPFMLAGYFVIQVMYNGLPRWVWYLVNARSPRPYPRFDSASKTALYMALALVDSVCVNLAVYLFVGASPESGPSFATRGLNNVWMLLYIGLPLLYALERSLLTPNPPRWIHVPYRNIKKANLTQRFVIWFVIASALLMLLVSVVVIAFASGDEESFQAVVRTMFHEVAILTVPIFLPMFVFLHILERRFTRPIEVLALDQQTFIERMESDVEQGRRDTCIAVDERGTKPRYEIAELYESTNKMRRDMVGFIERLYNVTAERQRTATELDVARQIQMSAVPHDSAVVANGCRAAAASSAQTAVNSLVASVDAFAGEAPQADDITMLAFRWNLPVARLTLPADDAELDNLFAFLEPICEGKGRTPKMVAQMMLVCEEVFVNICHYGFPDGQPRLPVDIEAAVDERAGCLHLVFSDQGIAYDPLSHDAKKVDPADEQRKGGLGILLMRKYMDDLRYTRADGRNILRMTKRFV